MTSVLALTDGSVTVATPGGVETVGWRDFFVGPLETSLHGPAVVTSAFFPALPPARARPSPRSPAARATTRSAAPASSSRWTPTAGSPPSAPPTSRWADPEVHDLTDAVVGQPVDGADWAAAGALARTLVDPDTDIHASADYRRLLVGVLTERTLASLPPRRGEACRMTVDTRTDDHRHRERCST